MTMRLTSAAFEHDQQMPREHTRDGENTSPPLSWRDVPEEARQLALIVDDPDAPQEEPFVHWVAYGIPAERDGLPPGLPKQPVVRDLGGMAQGENDFNELGYDGPAPPPNSGPHRYRFELFALDRPLETEAKVDHKALREAMRGKIIDRTMLVGTYERGEAGG